MAANDHIRYEPEQRVPPVLTLNAAYPRDLGELTDQLEIERAALAEASG